MENEIFKTENDKCIEVIDFATESDNSESIKGFSVIESDLESESYSSRVWCD